MFGSWYGIPAEGWCITSIFLVLMLKPKLSLTEENASISCCISCSLLALRYSHQQRGGLWSQSSWLWWWPVDAWGWRVPHHTCNWWECQVRFPWRYLSASPRTSIWTAWEQGRSPVSLHWSSETGLRRFHHQAREPSSHREKAWQSSRIYPGNQTSTWSPRIPLCSRCQTPSRGQQK